MIKMIMLLLVLFLVACALGAGFTKNLLVSIIIFMSYSLVMSVIWIFLSAPDLAITEAAVGAGVTYEGIGTDLDGAAFANPPSIGCYEFDGTVPPPAKRSRIVFSID